MVALLVIFLVVLSVVLFIKAIWLLLKAIWILLTIPNRIAAQQALDKDAAIQRELVIVAAMTEPMKAEYWARKHAEAQPRPDEPASMGKAIAILLMAFFGIGGGAFALMVIFGPQH